MSNPIITISRQMGSGGHTIAEMISERTGFELYDEKIVNMVAENSGLAPDFITQKGEYMNFGSLFDFSANMQYAYMGAENHNVMEQIFTLQNEVILNGAQKGPCIFVGRGANYLFKDHDNCIRIFIYSDMPHRVERAKNEYNLNVKNVEKYLKQRDTMRANYYKFHTGESWNSIKSYDLMISTAVFGIEGAFEMILNAMKRKNMI